jgi:hypothetical protein
MDGWMDGWIDIHTHILYNNNNNNNNTQSLMNKYQLSAHHHSVAEKQQVLSFQLFLVVFYVAPHHYQGPNTAPIILNAFLFSPLFYSSFF